MGRDGMLAAPARMMSNAQTVAKPGRRMKNATNMPGASAVRLRLNRRAVGELLDPRNDHEIARFDALFDDVVVARNGSDLDRLAACDESRPFVLGDERKGLYAE